MTFREESDFHHPGVPILDPGQILKRSAGQPMMRRAIGGPPCPLKGLPWLNKAQLVFPTLRFVRPWQGGFWIADHLVGRRSRSCIAFRKKNWGSGVIFNHPWGPRRNFHNSRDPEGFSKISPRAHEVCSRSILNLQHFRHL